MGKGEIARYEQFLLFPQCFQKVCFPGASKGVIVWEWENDMVSSARSVQSDLDLHCPVRVTESRLSAEVLTHSQRQILDHPKLKEFAGNNFKFDENRRKLSKPVETSVVKGEIARYEQVLLFPVFS